LNDKWILERLFLAVPELAADTGFIDALVGAGVLNSEHVRVFRRLTGRHKISALRGRPLLQRIMVVVPEIISVRTVNNVLSTCTPLNISLSHVDPTRFATSSFA